MHTKSYLFLKKIQVKHGLGNRLNGGQGENKIGGAHASTSCWHCNACMVICWKGISFESGTHQGGSRRKIQVINTTSGAGYMEVKVKQNRRCTSTSCLHCNACMIILWKGIAFAGRCTHSGSHQWGSTKKIQVEHNLRSRLYGGKG